MDAKSRNGASQSGNEARVTSMTHRSFFISAALAVLLFSSSATAQEPAPAGESAKSAAAAPKEKAVDLLKSLAGQVGALRSSQNRVRIGSNAADLLWEIDEERARRLFAAVTEDIKASFTDAREENYQDFKRYNYFQSLAVIGQLRRDTLERIARHDPQLASEFLRTTRKPDDEQMSYGMTESEKSLELRLAAQIAAKSPELALKLGRQTLASGLRPDLVPVLKQMKPGDKAAWQGFYKEIVDKLKTVNLMQDGVAESLAIDLAKAFSPPQADEQLYRDLLGLLVARALAQGCSESEEYRDFGICSELGSLFQQVEKYYPSRAAAFSGFARRAAERQARNQLDQALAAATIDEAIALAAKHPEMAEDIYWQAMVKATQVNDFPRAREVALKNPNEEQRRRMLSQIEYAERVTAEASSGNADKANSSRPKSDQERLNFIMRTAIEIGKTDRKAALAGFDEGAQIIESLRPSKAKLEMQIWLAVLYASLRSDRAFTIVESMMPRLNELISASAALNEVETNYLSDGEWNMTGQGAVGSLLTALAQNAGFFSRLDFDRSLTLANQLERTEVRLMAQLMMVQGVLSDRNPGQMTMPRN